MPYLLGDLPIIRKTRETRECVWCGKCGEFGELVRWSVWEDKVVLTSRMSPRPRVPASPPLPCLPPLPSQSTEEVLPLLPLRYQHSASLLGFRWIGRLTRLVPLGRPQDLLAFFGSTNRRLDRFDFSRRNGSSGTRIARSSAGLTHNLLFAKQAFSQLELQTHDAP